MRSGAPITALPIAGNRPDNAQWLLQTGIAYERASWTIVNVSALYLSDRYSNYSNYTNTEAIGGYTIYNAYVDLGGETLHIGPLQGLKLRFNVDSLGDKDYLGTITPIASGAASFRQGPDRTYQLTLTADF